MMMIKFLTAYGIESESDYVVVLKLRGNEILFLAYHCHIELQNNKFNQK